MRVTRVLFICLDNSARSQIAAAYLNALGAGRFKADSAGYKPKGINPLAIEVMQEEGIDISEKATNDLFNLYKEGRQFGYVINICDTAKGEECPIYPGNMNRVTWPVEDIANGKGSIEEKLDKMRKVRDEVKELVREFIGEVK
jgi:arsenate reductase